MPRESATDRAILRAVRREYPTAYARKIADRFTRGLADILIVFRVGIEVVTEDGNEVDDSWCLTLFVETKTSGGKTSKIQDEEHRQIRRAGGEVIVATSAADVLAKMREMGAVT